MTEEEKAAAEAVKKQAEEAAAEAAKKEGEDMVTMTKAEVEGLLTAAENATKLAEKKTSDAENYKKGMLKYKDKLKENGLDDEETPQAISEERIAQIVKETIEKTIPTVAKQKEDDELTVANNKIAEMRLAITNSKRPLSSAAGSNLDKDLANVKTSAEKYFSEEQKAEIKRKFPNADLESIYKNIPKEGEMRGAPQA